MNFDGREYTSVEFEGLYRAGEYREFGSMMFQATRLCTFTKTPVRIRFGSLVFIFSRFLFCNDFFVPVRTNEVHVTFLMSID